MQKSDGGEDDNGFGVRDIIHNSASASQTQVQGATDTGMP